MYREIINKLYEAGVVFSEGLNDDEIKEIENCYQIKFPEELKEFYREALPISGRFYNWRDLNEKNVKKIKERILSPSQELIEDISELEWLEQWGVEPDSETEKHDYILEKTRESCQLIPLFGHRYLASQFPLNNPVFSVYGTDIICYGENLTQYLMIEFKYEKHSIIEYDKIKEVNFWNDFL